MIDKAKGANKKAETTRAALLSPLYTNNTAFNLGGEFVAGPVNGLPLTGQGKTTGTPDPLMFAPFDLHKTAVGKAQRVEVPKYGDALRMVPEKPVTGIREAKVRKVEGRT